MIRYTCYPGLNRLDLNRLEQKGIWLGWLDLNQRMTESESVALPLGDTPVTGPQG